MQCRLQTVPISANKMRKERIDTDFRLDLAFVALDFRRNVHTLRRSIHFYQFGAAGPRGDDNAIFE